MRLPASSFIDQFKELTELRADGCAHDPGMHRRDGFIVHDFFADKLF
jgi:hypothetical protein